MTFNIGLLRALGHFEQIQSNILVIMKIASYPKGLSIHSVI